MSEEKPGDFHQKVDDLAENAREAGQRWVATDAGRRVAGATDTVLDTAAELARKAAASEIGKKAIDSDLGRQASDLAQKADGWTKTNIPNSLARTVAIGAAAGAVVAIPLPVIGWMTGALIGGAIGFVRAVSRQG